MNVGVRPSKSWRECKYSRQQTEGEYDMEMKGERK